MLPGGGEFQVGFWRDQGTLKAGPQAEDLFIPGKVVNTHDSMGRSSEAHILYSRYS